MRVNPADGRCRECGGALTIVDADDATMTVECDEGSHCYPVEHDAFGDGCMTYIFEFLAERLEGGVE